MNLIVVFAVFWMTVIGAGAWMVAAEMDDRKRERMFFRRLQAERRRLEERYGLR